MKKRILSIVLAICMVLTFVPITVFADSNSHTVTVNAGEGGKVSTDGTSWSNSVEVAVNDGETLDGKVQYKADEGYEFDGVVPKIVSAAGGQNHTVLLDAKGNVWTAGLNNNGQLGRKTSSDSDSTFKPVTVGDGVKIKAIAAGIYHTVLLDANGNVWTAGSNNSGQLGRTDSNTSTFTQVTNGISGVKITAIAAGYHHTVLLDEDCNVWTAGFNSDGQLGRTDSNTSTFKQVTAFDDIDDISRVKIKAIAAGGWHTVLLDEDNNVWTAGSNSEGQLGRTGGNNSTFTMVTKGIIGVNMTAIASGGYHTVLLDKDGNVWTAGLNSSGQLGRVTSSDSDAKIFTKVNNGIGGVNITAIAAGSKYTVLLDKGGNVWTAGDNSYGQLGRDTSPDSYDQTFTKVTNGISGVTIKAIAAGSAHTVLLDAKGSVWTAGYNYYGQLGRETNSDKDSTFKQATVSPDAITFDELINIPIHNNSVFLVKFRAKDYTVTVNAGEGGKVSTDGTSWSNSVSVKVDDGETLDGKVQYKADEGYGLDGVVPKIVSVAGGSSHTVLLDANGNVWTAGLNNYGQLGRDENGGTNNSNPTFTQVTVFDDIDDISKVKIKAIAAGDLHTVLLDEEGNVWTAGWNSYGQLGRDENSGTNNANPTFTQVTVFDDIDDISKVKIKAIAAGGAHTVLLDEDGNVWTAGLNNCGQLGISGGNSSTFTKVTDGISGVKIKAIAAGEQHTVLLDEDGNVWTAGLNNYGQLGRKTSSDSDSTFTQVTDGISGVKIKAIAAGGWHTVLLDEDGNVWTAGSNYYGQLGRDENKGAFISNSTFKQVTDGIGIIAIAAGGNHTVLLAANSGVWTAGNNQFGQLGRDTSPDSYDPTFTKVTDGISGVKIKTIAAGSTHTVLLDEDGNVWTAGLNNYGQLGRDENTNTTNANPTFTQIDVILNTITFDEFVNIPIHYNSVFIVKFKDIQKPVITELEKGKTYCDTVEFTVTDNGGIASVKANNVELTATNGKYTLEKGKGTVTVVATDNSGNTAEVTVTVNNGHTWNNGVCSVCGYPCSHDYDSVVTPPTCTESGYTTHTCANCGNSYVDSEVPATGHSFKFFKCVNCGMHYGCKGANCVFCSIVRWFDGLINSCEIWLTEAPVSIGKWFVGVFNCIVSAIK